MAHLLLPDQITSMVHVLNNSKIIVRSAMNSTIISFHQHGMIFQWLAVATRQACYDGALGARGIMHALQSYQQDGLGSTYDNSAYTLTSTYHGGTLKLYTTHLTESKGSGDRPEYIMTQLNTWGMTGNLETFRQGLLHSRSQHQMGSEAAPTVDDSDVSTLSDEAEYSKAQWSFAAPAEEGEEEILSRNSKRPRVETMTCTRPASLLGVDQTAWKIHRLSGSEGKVGIWGLGCNVAANGRDIVRVTGTKNDASSLCEIKFNFHEYSAPCARIHAGGKVNRALKFSILLHLLGQNHQSVRAPTSPRNNWYRRSGMIFTS
ncbi:hypothetical protein BDBG_05891 [Blastomyces gilchristii SLH14081]|uniref:Uncharacterized protein n=1 Tax=Blastomyces gilchristii (strain SLH14081) TaxID=559298 RepID=A0A179UQD4_BLAGS|nr:uncharacterized protein BDBG_05891 [Blastomyces gilchristii SLH14081]OAT10224.1 hypothetical protein BDBG_05891 [Blastomyces gilchristii SLH14081]